MTVVLEKGAEFEFAEDSSFSAYRFERWPSTGYSVVSIPAPTGTQFSIETPVWNPPGDSFPATRISTDLPVPAQDRFGRSLADAILTVDQSVFRFRIARPVPTTR